MPKLRMGHAPGHVSLDCMRRQRRRTNGRVRDPLRAAPDHGELHGHCAAGVKRETYPRPTRRHFWVGTQITKPLILLARPKRFELLTPR